MNQKNIKINAVGDVWFGDHPVCIGHGVRSLSKKKGCEYFFSDIKHHFDDGDINFCNLEGVLSDIGLQRNKLSSIEMRGAPESVDSLSYCGINLVSIANNHILQHGREAFEGTLRTLEKYKIDYVGIDESNTTNTAEYNVGGEKIVVVSYSFHQESYYEGKPLYSYRNKEQQSLFIEEIGRIRRQSEGVLVCSIHWGAEFVTQPSPEQIKFARQIVDAGVNIILGHHPHVVQGVELYNGSLICYSLGNFLFDLWDEETKKTVIAKIEIDSDRKISYELIPVYIKNDFKLVEMKGTERVNYLQEISKRSKDIDVSSKFDQSTYQEMAQSAEISFRYSSYRYFLKNIHRYSPTMLMQTIYRTLLRKMGLG